MVTQKRPKPKQQLSPLQKKKVLRISVVLVLAAVLWVLFAPGSGVVLLIKKRTELQRLQEKTVHLEEDNKRLQNDIDRLRNDPGYLEEIARRDYGLLRKDERVFDFSRDQPAREEE